MYLQLAWRYLGRLTVGGAAARQRAFSRAAKSLTDVVTDFLPLFCWCRAFELGRSFEITFDRAYLVAWLSTRHEPTGKLQ